MLVTKETAAQIKRVCVIGPECTGKTELSKYLAETFKTAWVEEYARAYLNKLGRPYDQIDLVKIAHGQLRMEDEWLYESNRVLICDTNLLVIKIWSEHKYGNVDQDILRRISERKYDHYLLTYIDVPWEEDPQREHPDKREHFYQRFHDEVVSTGVPFTVISGSREERQQKAVAAINQLLAGA